jgi:hypothetical protein
MLCCGGAQTNYYLFEDNIDLTALFRCYEGLVYATFITRELTISRLGNWYFENSPECRRSNLDIFILRSTLLAPCLDILLRKGLHASIKG